MPLSALDCAKPVVVLARPLISVTNVIVPSPRTGGAPLNRRELVGQSNARQERACRYQRQDSKANEVPNHEILQVAENRSAANCVLYRPPRPATALTAPNAVASLRRGPRCKLFTPGMQRNEPAESHCQRGRHDAAPRS